MAKANSKNRISVDMKDEERAALDEAAAALGVTVSEFVRGAVGVKVAHVRSQIASGKALTQAVESAYDALDKTDAEDGVSVTPTPKAQASSKVDLTKHPCIHLNAWRPPNFTAGEIPGTCNKQGLKPCHFHGNSARSCVLFAPANNTPGPKRNR